MAHVQDLAVLSLDVAQQIDRKLGGEQADEGVLKSFGEALSKMSGDGLTEGPAFLASDPTTTGIFAQAAGEVSSITISSIDGLSAVMKQIVGPLLAAEVKIDPEHLILIKRFSLAFHRSLLAHQLSGFHEDEASIGYEFCTA